MVMKIIHLFIYVLRVCLCECFCSYFVLGLCECLCSYFVLDLCVCLCSYFVLGMCECLYSYLYWVCVNATVVILY